MPIPTQTPPEYRPPRWSLYASAVAVGLLYACAFVAINLFTGAGWDPGPPVSAGPIRVYGWPLVYMARGAFFHLPRPLYVSALHDSPLIRFRPTLLFLDVLCGGLLAVVATVIPAYWLRVRGRPVQFSLRPFLG